MSRYVKGQTYGQRVKVLVDLLHLYGRLDPSVATKTVLAVTENLTAEIRSERPGCPMDRVGR